MVERDRMAELMREFLASIQTLRMQQFGWETHVNHFDADMLRRIAGQMPEAADVLLIAARQREEA